MLRLRIVQKRSIALLTLVAAAGTVSFAQQQQATLSFSPANTEVHFVLGDVLHRVRGDFRLKSGVVHFTPDTNAISGELIVDATSGESGNGSRDRKMRKDVLESTTYPEITFRPDRMEGRVAPAGVSNVQVHGSFGIHGGEHEIVVPAQVDLTADHWDLVAHFDVPYVVWGLKDPSTLFLRVQKTVAIDLHASGVNPWHAQP